MAAHSSVVAWRFPGTGEPGGLPSMGAHSRTRPKRLSSNGSSSTGTLFLPLLMSVPELSLSLSYFNKSLSHKSSERSSLDTVPALNSCPPEAKNPGIIHSSAATAHCWDPRGDKALGLRHLHATRPGRVQSLGTNSPLITFKKNQAFLFWLSKFYKLIICRLKESKKKKFYSARFDSWGGHVCGDRVHGNSARFCCEPKTALKDKADLKKHKSPWSHPPKDNIPLSSRSVQRSVVQEARWTLPGPLPPPEQPWGWAPPSTLLDEDSAAGDPPGAQLQALLPPGPPLPGAAPSPHRRL